MKCPSCNGTGNGPRGVYSPRAPICLQCYGTGEVDETENEEEEKDNAKT